VKEYSMTEIRGVIDGFESATIQLSDFKTRSTFNGRRFLSFGIIIRRSTFTYANGSESGSGTKRNEAITRQLPFLDEVHEEHSVGSNSGSYSGGINQLAVVGCSGPW